jgi:hypothetical protein
MLAPGQGAAQTGGFVSGRAFRRWIFNSRDLKRFNHHLIPWTNAQRSTTSRPGTKRVSALDQFSNQKHCDLPAAVLK